MLPWILSIVYSFRLFLEVKVQLTTQWERRTSVSISAHVIMFDITQLGYVSLKRYMSPLEIEYVTCDMDCHNKYSYFIEQFGNQYLKSANIIDNHVLFPQSGSNFHTVLFPPQRMNHFPNYMHIFYALVPETVFSVGSIITVHNSEINI